jgi:hypothetical protein
VSDARDYRSDVLPLEGEIGGIELNEMQRHLVSLPLEQINLDVMR